MERAVGQRESSAEIMGLQNIPWWTALEQHKRYQSYLSHVIWFCAHFAELFPSFLCRLVRGSTFGPQSSVKFIVSKLDKMFVILNRLMDCFDILNTISMKFIVGVLAVLVAPVISCIFGKFKWVTQVFRINCAITFLPITFKFHVHAMK